MMVAGHHVAGMDDPLAHLLGSSHAARFLETHWQRKPLHVKHSGKHHWQGTTPFDRARLLDLLPLPLASSMRVVRCEAGGRREAAAEPDGGVATREYISAALGDGYTCQLFGPQRHCPLLASFCSRLEERFGCLVGCSAYLTPAGCQGLAPHHDDVDVFILQTEGSKRWTCYAPFEGHELPLRHSGDLPRDRLGPVLLDVTLRQGELLYLPRGIVHEARSAEDFSSHLTLSTYQQHSWADLLATLLPMVLAAAADERVELRRGLPLDFLQQAGSGRAALDPAAGVATAELMREARRALQLCVDSLAPAQLAAATDAFGADYFANRLPPPAEAPAVSGCAQKRNGCRARGGEGAPAGKVQEARGPPPPCT